MTKSPNTAEQPSANEPFDWRALLSIHPAAELFPPLNEDELKELAEDIRLNGLRVPMVTWEPQEESSGPALLDGRSRLDALARVGLLYETDDHHIGLRTWIAKLAKWAESSGDRLPFEHVSAGDPYALAVSLNVHRRHLSNADKRDLIAKLIKANPEKSNKAIADQGKAFSYPTVAKVRKALEASGDVEKFATSIDTLGRRQPRAKTKVFWKAPPRSEAEKVAARTAMLRGSPAWPAILKTESVVGGAALHRFDGLVGSLLQLIRKAKPAQFALTDVKLRDLTRLSDFLAKIASAVKADAS